MGVGRWVWSQIKYAHGVGNAFGPYGGGCELNCGVSQHLGIWQMVYFGVGIVYGFAKFF